MKANQKLTIKLNKAIALFQSGKKADAQKILKEINRKKNAPAISWFVSAIIHTQNLEYPDATKAFKKAILLQPDYPDAHNNLAVILETENNIDGAIKHYKIAIKQRSNYASALFNLGNIYHNQNYQESFTLAEKYYQRAIESDPHHPKAYNNLGLLYQQNHIPEKAMPAFQSALRNSPNDHEVLNNIGRQYHLDGNYDKALQHYQQADILCPNNAKILNNIGVTLFAKQQYLDAEIHFQSAINLEKNYHEAITNLANLYSEIGKTPLAKQLYLKALEIKPDSVSANNNYGLTFHRQGKYDIAKTFFEAAIKNNKNDNEAKYNLCINRLANGKFCDGWQYYHARPTIRHPLTVNPKDIQRQDLQHKNVLLVKEQGIGDELFFLRFSSQLKQICGKIACLCTEKISPFIQQIPDIDALYIDEKKIDHFDIAISMGDLPAILVKEDTNIPQTVTLNAYPEYENELRKLLASFGPPPYIGITWRSGTREKDTLFKSIPIPDFLHSIKDINATFIALQRDPTPDERDKLKIDARFSNMPDLSQLNEDLPRMLTLLSLLDDYIGVSNTNMHLRAALGKSAKVLIPHPPEWRWMFSGSSPWFPDFDVLRQTPDGDWGKALSELNWLLQNEKIAI